MLAYSNQGLVTAFMERLNSPFSVVKRKARRYRTVENMIAMLHFIDGKLSLPCYLHTDNSSEFTLNCQSAYKLI